MSDTQTIKDRIDIVQLIQEYVPLKKAGVNWKACCPFHHEKSPSFMAHQEKQIWHCFGCQKGGDIFSFLQEIEGIDFPEALKILAERAGVKLQSSFQSETQKSQKNRIMEINAKAAYFFHHFLLQMDAGKQAREYLRRRGLSDKTIEEWQVGFIPEQWDLLTQYFLKKGNSIDDLLASGLTITREGAELKSGRGYYDRFRGRIMFPIWDVHGNTVGFTGRVMVEKENSGGKYVNTPQTMAFDKSRVLYGLNKAKLEIKSKDEAVIVEGQMDVIACHQAGMKNVVASSGTALTSEQVKLLKRYAANLAMAFDADKAGENAAKRGIDMAVQEGMRVRVIRIPGGAGKDADECLKKNPQIWHDSVKNAEDVMTWHLSSILAKADINSPRGKQQAAAALLTEVSKIPFPVERSHWLEIIADKIGTDSQALREELQRVGSSLKHRSATPERQNVVDVSDSAGSSSLVGVSARLNILLENLWALFLKFPRLLELYWDKLLPDYFIHSPYESLYEIAKLLYNNKTITLDAFRASFTPQGGENLLDILLLKGESYYLDNNEEEASREAGLLVYEIRKEWTRERKAELMKLLKKAEAEKNTSEIERFFKEIKVLEN